MIHNRRFFTRAVVLMALLAMVPCVQAIPALSGIAGWTTIMFGTGRDPQGDSQAGAADTDIIADAVHGSLYTGFDGNGTVTIQDDYIYFRLRIDNPTATNNFAGVAVVGIDANLDGKVDLFMTVDGRNNGQFVRLMDPGSGANISPSTTSTSPLPAGWLANNGIYPFTAANYAVVPVNSSTDPHWNGNNDLGNDGKVDVFVSWRIPLADLATVLAIPSPVDRNGVYGPRGATGIAGYNQNTICQYVTFTQTQNGPINGDLLGVGASYDKNATFASLGVFTAPMSAANPVSSSDAVTISKPVDANGLINATEDDAVTVSGTVVPVSSWVRLTTTDGVTSLVVWAQANGSGVWTAASQNLSALADGTLTFTAVLVTGNGSNTIVANSTGDTTTALHDTVAPIIGIDPLSTAGRPTISGTSTDVPAGSIITVTIDPNGDGILTDVVTYSAVVGAGGVWSVNTAAVSPASGTMPSAGLTAYAKITASGQDAAGNTGTATAIDKPAVNARTTNVTTPSITGTWGGSNGGTDTLTVTVNGVPYTTGGGNLVTNGVNGVNWTLNVPTVLALGTYPVTATTTRSGTPVNDPTTNELVITAGPAVTITGGASATSANSKPVIAGTSTVISGFIRVTINGTIVYSVATDGSGNWTLNTATAVPVSGTFPLAGMTGALAIVATATDSSGNIATASQTLTVTIPTLSITSITSSASTDANAVVNNADLYINMTEDNAIELRGTSANAVGQTVTITVSDNDPLTTDLQITALVASDGKWTNSAWNISAMRDGPLTFTATVSTASASDSTYTHDGTAPRMVYTMPNVEKKTSTTITLYSDLPLGSTITVANSVSTETQSGTVDANGNISVLFTVGNWVNPTTLTATTSATDLAGNKTQNAVTSLDAGGSTHYATLVRITAITGWANITDPTITTNEIASGITISGTTDSSAGTLNVTVTDFDGNTTYTFNTVTHTNTWSVSLSNGQVNALHNGTLTVTATLVGASATDVDKKFPILDLRATGTGAAPTITITSAGDANLSASEDNPVTIIGTSTIAPNGDTVSISVSDGTNPAVTGTTTVNPTNSWTISTLNLSGLNNGTLTITASVTANGQTATDTATIQHDRSPPLIAILTGPSVANSTPTISGTTDNPVGSTLTMTIDTDNNGSIDVTYTVTVQTGGTWSLNTGTATPTSGAFPAAGMDANSKVTVSATDSAGNSTSIIATTITAITNDTGLSGTDFITNDPTLVFSGKAEPGSSVAVSLNGSLIGTVTATGGSWSFDYTGTPLAGGTYTLTALATKSAGVTALATQIFTVDLTAPAVAITSITTDTAGASTTDFITSDNTLIFTGTAEANSSVLVVLKDSSNVTIFSTTVAATGGNWSVNRTGSSLLDGTYTLTATATDSAGNSTIATQSVAVDTAANISITTNSTTSDTTPVITGTTDIEVGRNITVTISGATYTVVVQAGGNWSVDVGSAIPSSGSLTALTNGNTYSIVASGTDAAGNFVTTTKSLTIDTSAPVIVVTEPIDSGGNNILDATEDNAVTIHGTTANVPVGSTIYVTITDGTTTISDTATVTGTLASGAWTLAVINLSGLANGVITVTATYTNPSGTPFNDIGTVLHDKSGTLTIDSITTDTGVIGDFITRDNTLVFSGSAAASASVGVTLTNSSNAQVFTNTVTASTGGIWTFNYTGTTLPDGTYTLYARTSGTVTQVIVIDTLAPVGPVTVNSQATTNTTPTITGTSVVGGGETLTVTVNGVTYTAGDGHLTLTGTNWSLVIPPAGALDPEAPGGFNGIYNVVATITDTAGNSLTDSGTGELTIYINHVPSFTKGANQTVVEDAGMQTVSGWATAISAGSANDSGQVVNFIVSNNNNPLFLTQPAVSATGTLTFTPAANAFGSATVTVALHDDGGVVNGGTDTSANQTFVITITPVADTPSVTGASTLEDVQTTSGLVISRNVADGAEVTHFKITGISNGTLYQNNGSTVINNGDFITFAQGNAGLKFTPALNSTVNGTFVVQASTSNVNGGLGGATVTATITVTSVNDAPSGANNSVTTLQDTTYTFTTANFGFTDPNDSPANALLAVKITTLPTAGTLYSNTVPVVAGWFIPVADITGGKLKFTPVGGALGTPYATFTFQVQDDGTTANTGVDLDPTPNTMTVNVTAVSTPILSADNLGTNYWVAFPGNVTPASSLLTVTIMAESATTGTVSVPGLTVPFSANFALAAGGVTTITIPSTASVDSSNVIENKGVHIVATQRVAVHVMNRVTTSTDGYLALAAEQYGTNHIALGYKNGGAVQGSQFTIVACSDSTTVRITPTATTGTRVGGMPYLITLNAGQTYQLRNTVRNSSLDLSGSIIDSDKPIGVFGGHLAANIPVGPASADYLVEQLPPTCSWGKTFLTVPLATRTGDTFRILASIDGTTVKTNGVLLAALNRGQIRELILTSALKITADKPVLVAQYANGNKYDNVTLGDPMMMIVPPMEQYLASYTFNVPSTTGYSNYVNVAVTNSAVPSMRLNGAPIAPASFTAIGTSGYSRARLLVTPGVKTLTGSAPFAALLYGFASVEGFGYPVGMNVAAIAEVSSLTLSPLTASLSIGGQHTATATVTRSGGSAVRGVRVDFIVTGANARSAFAFTDSLGQALLTYTGTNNSYATDNITATVGSLAATSTVTWGSPNSPTIAGPRSSTVEATGPAGASVSSSANFADADGNALTVKWYVDGSATASRTMAISAGGPPTAGSDTYTQTYALGMHTVLITVDDGGNTSSQAFTINVTDTTAPVVTVTGANPMTLNLNTPLVDPGATASDTAGGNLTGLIVVTGTVDVSQAGTYLVTYTVTDPSGNTSSSVRTVRIVDPSAPAITVLADSSGTNFFLAFPGNVNAVPELSLVISSTVNTVGTVTVPGLGYTKNFSVTAGLVTTVLVPAGASVDSSDLVEAKGVSISTVDEVTVYAVNRIGTSTDSYLVIPADALGTDYIALGYKNGGTILGSQLTLVGTVNGTVVTITPTTTTGARTAGVPYNVNLNAGQTYQLRNLTNSTAADLSGSLISSTQPISVFGGHRAANVPYNVSSADYLVEQLPPTTAWGRKYITSPLATRTGDTFRILASASSTAVSLNGVAYTNLNRGKFAELVLTNGTCISADKPILVAQYANSYRFDNVPNSDPFMMIVPSYEQWVGDYSIATIASGYANYLNVVVTNAATSSISVDGVLIPAGNFTAISTSGFSYVRLSIAAGSYRLTGPVPFGVTVYGFAATEAYGHPGGMNFAAIADVNSVALAQGSASTPVATTTHTVTATATRTVAGAATWSATGAMSTARQYQTETLLPNGKVLVSGGYGSSGPLSSAELYDPVGNGGLGSWTTTAAMSTARYLHKATLLPNGKVLVTGGRDASFSALSSAELYDPAGNGGLGSWTATGAMSTARYQHTATLLPNGKVLVSGGYGVSSHLSSAELYDPAGNGGLGSWSATGALNTARESHRATLLPNGKVLVSGGYGSSGPLSSAELYDPAGNGGLGSWTTTGAMSTARYLCTATLLPNGKVLVAGGSDGSISYFSSAELYDPAGNGGSGSWTTTGALSTARSFHTATLLANGKVLVAGGYRSGSGGGYLSSAELYDPAGNGGLGSWTTTGAMSTARGYYAATLLANGKVLVSGGASSSFISSAELYDPGTVANARPGVRVDFKISGHNSIIGFAFTDGTGVATFIYTNLGGTGTDTIEASVGTVYGIPVLTHIWY